MRLGCFHTMGTSEVLMNMSPLLFVDHPCDKALRWTKRRLSRAGLRAMQTFDLHTARAALHDCSCPKHGTEDCDCQMVILLVYGNAESPATLFLHGNDDRTWLSIADTPPRHTDIKLLEQIRSALKTPNPALQT